MEYLDNELFLEITITEFVICFLFSTIGFTLKELVLRRNTQRPFKKAFVESVIVISTSTILSIMINPFISLYSKRLVALTPFILSVIGMDFIMQILSVNSLFNLVTRAFNVFGLFRGKEVKDDKEEETPHKDNSSNNNNSNSFDMESSIRKEDYHIDKYTVLHLLESSILSTTHNIEIVMATYYRHHDKVSFYEMYIEIEKQYNIIRDTIHSVDYVPFVLTTKIVILVSKKKDLDDFYHANILVAEDSEE
jgi:hypothetical protein